MTSAKAVRFLAKKSWHTATMRHMEKVWLAEQRAASEDKKMAELRQELAEEREMEALRKAHESATGIKKSERVDFLYSEPLLNEPSADDYLLGAKYKDKVGDNDVKNVQTKPGSLWLDQPALTSDSIQDKRTKIREDPLFIIKKEEQNQKTTLKNNPIKMQKLRKEILMRKLQEELKKEKKRKRNSEPSSSKRDRREEGEERYSKRERSDHKDPKHTSPPLLTYRKKEYTEAERLQKLQEMQQNAVDLEKERIARINTYNQEYTEESLKALSKDNRKITPQFINSMGQEVFTSASTASIEDRVKRNRFYIQKDNLDERGIFK